MKLELIVPENDAESAEALAVVDHLRGMTDMPNTLHLRAQTLLIEDYELQRQSAGDRHRTLPLIDATLDLGLTANDLSRVLGTPVEGERWQLLGQIREALDECFPENVRPVSWMHKPVVGPPFDGRSPLDLMSEGPQKMREVLSYLQHAASGAQRT